MRSFGNMLSLLFFFSAYWLLQLPPTAAAHQARSLEQRRRHVLLSANDTHTVEKRGGAQFTHFAPGLGACGKYNTASDLIVALNAQQWDGGSHCFKTITVFYQGKSVQAQITDECMGCPYNGLDLSPATFSALAEIGLDEMVGSWSFGSGGGDDAPEKSTTKAPAPTSHKPSPSPSPSPTPTTSREQPSSTSTHTTHTSASGSPTPSPSPGSSLQTTTSIAPLSGSVAPTSTALPEDFLALVNMAVVQFGELIQTGLKI